MSFFAILCALLLEQARPLALGNPVHAGARAWVRWVLASLDAGKSPHARLAWCVAVLLPSLAACALHWGLWWLAGWPAAAVWSVVVLYCTLGFRQFSHHFTLVRDALLGGDEASARQHLSAWVRTDVEGLQRADVVGLVIEQSVLHAHRHVFGVLAWHGLLAMAGLGPAGAVLYRLAEFFDRYAHRPLRPTSVPVSAQVQAVARSAWFVLDWLPARLTALGFAFAGSFEDAIDAWRQWAGRVDADSDGFVLAATSGAVNVSLRSVDPQGLRPAAQIAHLSAVVGLVWRTVVMWMVLLALLSLARLLG